MRFVSKVSGIPGISRGYVEQLERLDEGLAFVASL